jgi:hypothetical protein
VKERIPWETGTVAVVVSGMAVVAEGVTATGVEEVASREGSARVVPVETMGVKVGNTSGATVSRGAPVAGITSGDGVKGVEDEGVTRVGGAGIVAPPKGALQARVAKSHPPTKKRNE